MKVWSLSPFFKENDVLEIRLAEMAPFVDVFVLCEATRTHMGDPKPLTFDHERFQPWREKIRYLVCDFPDGLDDWGRENYQREQLGRGLEGLQPDDIVIVSDVDEILKAETVQALRDGELKIPCHFAMPLHPYRLDWRAGLLEEGGERCSVIRGRNLAWNEEREMYEGAHAAIGISFCRFFDPGYVPFQARRYCPDHIHYLGEYGWHFTYMGSEQEILEKTRSIADEWVKDAADMNSARAAISDGTDLYGRPEMASQQVPLEQLPVYVQRNQERFSRLLRGTEVPPQLVPTTLPT